MSRLKAIGYWRTLHDGITWPHPREVVTTWDPPEKARVVRYLRAGVPCAEWLGFAHCRFEDGPSPVVMGNRDLTDGVWVWPEGLAVYVERYDVALPPAFRRTAAENGYVVPDDPQVGSDRGREGYSFDEWTSWCNSVRSNRVLALLSRLFSRWTLRGPRTPAEQPPTP
jgi:hypothetical protein